MPPSHPLRYLKTSLVPNIPFGNLQSTKFYLHLSKFPKSTGDLHLLQLPIAHRFMREQTRLTPQRLGLINPYSTCTANR